MFEEAIKHLEDGVLSYRPEMLVTFRGTGEPVSLAGLYEFEQRLQAEGVDPAQDLDAVAESVGVPVDELPLPVSGLRWDQVQEIAIDSLRSSLDGNEEPQVLLVIGGSRVSAAQLFEEVALGLERGDLFVSTTRHHCRFVAEALRAGKVRLAGDGPLPQAFT